MGCCLSSSYFDLLLLLLREQMRRSSCRFSAGHVSSYPTRHCGVNDVPIFMKQGPAWTWWGAVPTAGRLPTGASACSTVIRTNAAPDTEPEVSLLWFPTDLSIFFLTHLLKFFSMVTLACLVLCFFLLNFYFYSAYALSFVGVFLLIM